MKNLKIDNTARIVIGSIATLLFIAIVHFVLYAPKARELSNATVDYNAALQQYNDFASKNLPASDLKKIETEVSKMSDNLDKVIDRLQIGKEMNYQIAGELFVNKLNDIRNIENAGGKTQYKVLTDWMIVDGLPGIENDRIPVILTQLKEKKNLINLLSNDSTNINSINQKNQFENQYRDLLKQITLNKTDLDKLPPVIVWLKQLKVFDYVKDKKANSSVKNDGELFYVLDMPIHDSEWMKQTLFFLDRTKLLMNMASQSGIASVNSIKPLDKVEIRPIEKATPTPTPGAGMGMDLGGMFMDPAMMMGMGSRGGMMGGMFGAMGKPTPTKPAEPPLAWADPVEVQVTGEYNQLIRYLYNITHSANMMDIKDLEITTNDDGTLTAKIIVNNYRDLRAVNQIAKKSNPVAQK